MIKVKNPLIALPLNVLLWLVLSTFFPEIFFTLYMSKL